MRNRRFRGLSGRKSFKAMRRRFSRYLKRSRR